MAWAGKKQKHGKKESYQSSGFGVGNSGIMLAISGCCDLPGLSGGGNSNGNFYPNHHARFVSHFSAIAGNYQVRSFHASASARFNVFIINHLN